MLIWHLAVDFIKSFSLSHFFVPHQLNFTKTVWTATEMWLLILTYWTTLRLCPKGGKKSNMKGFKMKLWMLFDCLFTPELIASLKLDNVWVFFSWFIGRRGKKISHTKTQTLPNLRLPISSGSHCRRENGKPRLGADVWTRAKLVTNNATAKRKPEMRGKKNLMTYLIRNLCFLDVFCVNEWTEHLKKIFVPTRIQIYPS